ncbi:MAG: serine/threonine-protein kinase [Candidatus Obscuribacterales bacterium]|nr:serine/threonine-protein kinase [Candidatus Obscuribacterales bacterium]
MSTDNLEEAKPDALVGSLVDGRFSILELVGEGGIGVVYKARHVLMDRIVAFKMMRSEFLGDEVAFGRFQQEARAVCALSHPNIVSAFDFGVTVDGHAYLAMDFLEGLDLDTYIAEKGALDLRECFPIFLQVCEALAHAHNVGIIHRDLKPSNIVLINPAVTPPMVKLVDFGMAKFTAGASLKALKLTKPGDVFGSPYYMSPEQFSGPDLDARSDIYSLGILMYEAVTGLPPHLGDDYLEVMRNHLASLPEPKGVLANTDAVSVELKRIIFKMLEKAPAARYQTVEEVLLDLRRVAKLAGIGEASSEPILSPPSAAESAVMAAATTIGANQFPQQLVTAENARMENQGTINSLKPARTSTGMLVAIALLVLAGIGGAVLLMTPRSDTSTQSVSNWQQLDESAARAAAGGDLAKAEVLYGKAVAEASTRGETDNPELSKSLASLGLILHRQKKYLEAEATLKRAINICKKQTGFDASELSPLMVKLGEVYKDEGKAQEADAIHQKVKSIIDGSFERSGAAK